MASVSPDLDYGLKSGEYRTNGKRLVCVLCVDGDEVVVEDCRTLDMTNLPCAVVREWTPVREACE